MCANYRPSTPESLKSFPLPPPDFAYGEAYPGSVVPIVTNFAPRQWVPASFGLMPGWARDAKILRSTYNARTETLADGTVIPAELPEAVRPHAEAIARAAKRLNDLRLGLGSGLVGRSLTVPILPALARDGSQASNRHTGTGK